MAPPLTKTKAAATTATKKTMKTKTRAASTTTTTTKRKKKSSPPPPQPRAPQFAWSYEKRILDLIRSRREAGTRMEDLKKLEGISISIITKRLDSLEKKNLIKRVVDIRYKKGNTYVAVEFEPSNELTGGFWYEEGSLNQDLILGVTLSCLRLIYREDAERTTAVEDLVQEVNRVGVSRKEVTAKEIEEIAKLMVLEDEVEEVVHQGRRFYTKKAGMSLNTILQRKRGGGEEDVGVSALVVASNPCTVCPVLHQCRSDGGGLISPQNCVYYNKWLDF